jgi:hypothetical protein
MTKKTWWLLGILLGLILIGLGIFFGYYLPKKVSKTNNNSNSNSTTKNSNNTNQSQTTEEQAQNGAGWKIFKNSHGYLIEYPNDATVENGSASEGKKDKSAIDAYCVKISTKYVWVVIAARDIPDNIFCLRTGVGTEWSNAPSEQITAAGQTYTANGMKTEAASAGYYKDDYQITTLSGERIEYGIDINEKYDSAMTKAQAKDIVHKMVASFSPAE